MLARSESLVPPSVFAELMCGPAHLHSLMHAHDHLDSQEYIGAFQSLCIEISHFSALSFMFLVSPLFAPAFIHCFGQRHV